MVLACVETEIEIEYYSFSFVQASINTFQRFAQLLISNTLVEGRCWVWRFVSSFCFVEINLSIFIAIPFLDMIFKKMCRNSVFEFNKFLPVFSHPVRQLIASVIS